MESALPQKRGRKQGHYLSLLSNKQRKWRNAFHVKNEKMTSKVMSITRLFLFIFPYLKFFFFKLQIYHTIHGDYININQIKRNPNKIRT